MEISLNGQDAFLVKTTSGSVICDPKNDEDAKFVPVSAADDTVINAVLGTNPDRSVFRGKSADSAVDVISHPGEYEIGDLGIRGIALLAASDGEAQKTTTSFRIDAEGLSVLMLGLPTAAPDSRATQIIGHVDVLLVDAAHLNIDVKELSSFIGSLDPSVVLSNGLERESAEPNPLLTAMLGEAGSDTESKEPQLRVNVTRSSLPAQRQLVVLRPR